MPRETPAQAAARNGARLVLGDSNLSEQGEALYASWAEEADRLRGRSASLWEEDWELVLRGFRSTEGALKALNAHRLVEEEEEPFSNEEELAVYFRESEDWDLMFSGKWGLIPVRVWAFAPWDGNLAYVVAVTEEDSAAVATSLN